MLASSERQLYPSLNAEVLGMVPASVRRLLDLGCGTGTFGQTLKARQPCEVVGVTYNPKEAEAAALKLDQVIVADLNSFDPVALGRFDCVVCSHVLEHLFLPEELLVRLQPCLLPAGELIVALPNVLFWPQRFAFLRGSFQYSDQGGLMDRTHYRFFDWRTAQALVTSSGYDIREAIADGYLPLSWLAPPLRPWLNRQAIRWFPGFFGIQFRFRCVVKTTK